MPAHGRRRGWRWIRATGSVRSRRCCCCCRRRCCCRRCRRRCPLVVRNGAKRNGNRTRHRAASARACDPVHSGMYHLPARRLFTTKSDKIFRVGIFLDSASASTRTPHGVYVQMGGQNRIDPNWGEIERLRARRRQPGHTRLPAPRHRFAPGGTLNHPLACVRTLCACAHDLRARAHTRGGFLRRATQKTAPRNAQSRRSKALAHRTATPNTGTSLTQQTRASPFGCSTCACARASTRARARAASKWTSTRGRSGWRTAPRVRARGCLREDALAMPADPSRRPDSARWS